MSHPILFLAPIPKYLEVEYWLQILPKYGVSKQLDQDGIVAGWYGMVFYGMAWYGMVWYRVEGVAQAALDEKFGLGRKF